MVTMMTMVMSSFENVFEQMFKSLILFLFILLDDFFNFKQIVLMVNFLLAVLTKIKLRTGRTLISYSHDGSYKAAFTLIALVNYGLI
jgi:hypothetical protein